MEIGLRRADLVVMCTHGRSGLGRWIYGSVAENVIARSPIPVLLVPPTGDPSNLKLEVGRAPALVPLDGSAHAEAALSQALTMAGILGGGLVVLRAVSMPFTAYSDPNVLLLQEGLEGEIEAAENYVAGIKERLSGSGVAVQTFVREGWSAESILSLAHELDSKLIVMSTHGRTGLARMILGSVAMEVVRRSSLPILLVRPSGLTVTAAEQA
jgi:nucleotide-binding universal stress UspA family protein